MITGGIDVGIKYTKVVILKDKEIIAEKTGVSGGAKREENAAALWKEALAQAGLERSQVKAVFSTGKGKHNVSFADKDKTEIVSMTKAIRTLYPSAAMAVNMGADEILVSVFGDTYSSGVAEMAQNQKCSAGLGLMIENLTEEFGWDYERTGDLSGEHSAVISDGCAVFARMDILECLNKGMSKEEVMIGAMHAAAVRANSVINDITYPNTEEIVLCGGLSKNNSFVKILEEKSGKTLKVCDHGEYICAIGAALLAAESENVRD